jgi:phosphate transport system protein
MLRIVPEIERSHDLVVHIAEHATHILGDELSPRCRGLVQRMGETATEMWNQAANAWYQRDPWAAQVLEERDDDMDSLHSALMAELASGRMSLPVAMDMTLVARFYERLADHSVNIARRVAYVAGPKREK